MAFIHCPHCGREVSDLAHKCPGCGTSLDVYKENVIFCKYCGMEILPDEIHGETAFCVSCRRSQKIEITPLASLRSKSTEKRHIMIPADEIIIDKTEYKPLKRNEPQRNEQVVTPSYYSPIPINNVSNVYIQGEPSNGVGTTGFVFALLYLLAGWTPLLAIWSATLFTILWVINGFLWFLGFICSFIGMFKRPRGLAIAGFIISVIPIIIVLILVLFFGFALSEFRKY